MRLQLALAAAVLFSCLGAGCASTQAVRDSSANTAQLMRQVEPEVDRFRTAVQVGDADIAATVAAARVKDEAARIWLNQQVRFDSAAGNTKRLDLYAQMKSVSDSLLADDEAFLASKAKIEVEMTGLLKPLPATGPKLSKAVATVLVLGQDRSARAQFEEALDVWKAVIASTKENRDKLKKATKTP
jgi:outer membrane murein-binding lipoprotein Lpp